MSYQAIGGDKSDSNSHAKLQAILLPSLEGKRFLDIGCNEGFFCREAIRSGAKRVVGIEAVPHLAESARRNAPGAAILNQRWDTLPNEQFDVIIMLSALHYEPRPKDLMKRIYDRLAPGGLFILECGSVQSHEYYYRQAPRAVGTVHYPTDALYIDHILEDFAVRKIGPSVNQAGDPVPRFVFHCQRKLPTYIIVAAESGAGKTNIVYSLRKNGVSSFVSDLFFINQFENKFPLDDRELADFFNTLEGAHAIGKWIDSIKDKAMGHKLAKFIFDALPKEPDITVIDGYAFTNEIVLKEFEKLASANDVRCWLTRKIS